MHLRKVRDFLGSVRPSANGEYHHIIVGRIVSTVDEARIAGEENADFVLVDNPDVQVEDPYYKVR